MLETIERTQKARVQTNPAIRIISKFGGAAKLSAAIGRHEITIYKWRWPKAKGGTGGLIPNSAQALLIEAAARRGIALSYAEFNPMHGDEIS